MALAEDIAQKRDRLAQIEETVRRHERELNDMGGTVDHLVNTQDSMILPTLQRHTERIAAHDAATSEAHDYIMSQKGAWQLIQRAGIVVAAVSSAVGLAMRIWGHLPK